MNNFLRGAAFGAALFVGADTGYEVIDTLGSVSELEEEANQALHTAGTFTPYDENGDMLPVDHELTPREIANSNQNRYEVVSDEIDDKTDQLTLKTYRAVLGLGAAGIILHSHIKGRKTAKK